MLVMSFIPSYFEASDICTWTGLEAAGAHRLVNPGPDSSWRYKTDGVGSCEILLDGLCQSLQENSLYVMPMCRFHARKEGGAQPWQAQVEGG